MGFPGIPVYTTGELVTLCCLQVWLVPFRNRFEVQTALILVKYLIKGAKYIIGNCGQCGGSLECFCVSLTACFLSVTDGT